VSQDCLMVLVAQGRIGAGGFGRDHAGQPLRRKPGPNCQTAPILPPATKIRAAPTGSISDSTPPSRQLQSHEPPSLRRSMPCCDAQTFLNTALQARRPGAQGGPEASFVLRNRRSRSQCVHAFIEDKTPSTSNPSASAAHRVGKNQKSQPSTRSNRSRGRRPRDGLEVGRNLMGEVVPPDPPHVQATPRRDRAGEAKRVPSGGPPHRGSPGRGKKAVGRHPQKAAVVSHPAPHGVS